MWVLTRKLDLPYKRPQSHGGSPVQEIKYGYSSHIAVPLKHPFAPQWTIHKLHPVCYIKGVRGMTEI